MDDDADAKMILTVPHQITGRNHQAPGRPRVTWLNTIQCDLRAYNLTLNEAVDLAQNRPLWRGGFVPSGGVRGGYDVIAVENLGVFSSTTLKFISELGRRICVHTEDARETSYLFQRISIILQRFNSVLLHDTAS